MKKTRATPEALLASLEKATAGLLLPSESDAPLTPFRWAPPEGAELSPEALLRSLGLPPTTPVETTTVEETLGPFAVAEEEPSPEDVAESKRFKAVIELLEHELHDLRVYRVGKVDIDVYVLGRSAAGEWLGLKSHVVET